MTTAGPQLGQSVTGSIVFSYAQTFNPNGITLIDQMTAWDFQINGVDVQNNGGFQAGVTNIGSVLTHSSGVLVGGGMTISTGMNSPTPFAQFSSAGINLGSGSIIGSARFDGASIHSSGAWSFTAPSAVPLPPAALLFLSGLFGLCFVQSAKTKRVD